MHTYVLLYSDTLPWRYFKLDSGERMHRDKIPTQRMHAVCRIVIQGSCTKSFAEINGNCEIYCIISLEQLVAPICASHERIAKDAC